MNNGVDREVPAIRVVDGSELFEEQSHESRHASVAASTANAVAAKAPGARDRQKKKKK